ncbi:MAG: glycosyltransferase [Bryobacteraceae bacterium]|nr:glycosyltransferase [Bryobacteraceae bacterium]
MREAFVLSPECPWPAAGGGAVRTASIVEFLARRYEVDMALFRVEGEPDVRWTFPQHLLRRAEWIDLPRSSKAAGHRAVRNLWRAFRGRAPLVDRFAGFQAKLAQLTESYHYRLAVFEHLWTAPYASVLAGRCQRLVLDLHNVESRLYETHAAAEPFPYSALSTAFAKASARVERDWLHRFHVILAASEADASVARRLAPNARVHVYPNALPLVPRPAAEPEHVLIFSGNLEYHPNLTAIRFFRDAVWPRLKERWPKLRWRLIGKNPEAAQPLLAGDSRVEFTGAVRDAVPEIARGQVAIVPLLSGSGTRVKILEAWAAGVPVVSTKLGAEGLRATDKEHLLLADAAEPFAAAVNTLLGSERLCEELGAAGRRHYERHFTWSAAWERLADCELII